MAVKGGNFQGPTPMDVFLQQQQQNNEMLSSAAQLLSDQWKTRKQLEEMKRSADAEMGRAMWSEFVKNPPGGSYRAAGTQHGTMMRFMLTKMGFAGRDADSLIEAWKSSTPTFEEALKANWQYMIDGGEEFDAKGIVAAAEKTLLDEEKRAARETPGFGGGGFQQTAAVGTTASAGQPSAAPRATDRSAELEFERVRRRSDVVTPQFSIEQGEPNAPQVFDKAAADKMWPTKGRTYEVDEEGKNYKEFPNWNYTSMTPDGKALDINQTADQIANYGGVVVKGSSNITPVDAVYGVWEHLVNTGTLQDRRAKNGDAHMRTILSEMHQTGPDNERLKNVAVAGAKRAGASDDELRALAASPYAAESYFKGGEKPFSSVVVPVDDENLRIFELEGQAIRTQLDEKAPAKVPEVSGVNVRAQGGVGAGLNVAAVAAARGHATPTAQDTKDVSMAQTLMDSVGKILDGTGTPEVAKAATAGFTRATYNYKAIAREQGYDKTAWDSLVAKFQGMTVDDYLARFHSSAESAARAAAAGAVAVAQAQEGSNRVAAVTDAMKTALEAMKVESDLRLEPQRIRNKEHELDIEERKLDAAAATAQSDADFELQKNKLQLEKLLVELDKDRLAYERELLKYQDETTPEAREANARAEAAKLARAEAEAYLAMDKAAIAQKISELGLSGMDEILSDPLSKAQLESATALYEKYMLAKDPATQETLWKELTKQPETLKALQSAVKLLNEATSQTYLGRSMDGQLFTVPTYEQLWNLGTMGWSRFWNSAAAAEVRKRLESAGLHPEGATVSGVGGTPAPSDEDKAAAATVDKYRKRE